MQKKYEAPSVAEIKFQQLDIMSVSSAIAMEETGDGQLAPDIFFGG